MDFGRKLLIGALTLMIGAGAGEYALYKKFEKSPDTIREVARWPYNGTWTEVDALAREYEQLTNLKLKSIHGKIQSVDVLASDVLDIYPTLGGSVIKRNSINFIELESGKKYIYIGTFFSKKDWEVELRVLPARAALETRAFLERVETFRNRHPTWLWTIQGYDGVLTGMPITKSSLRIVPSSKLNSLDGIIESYEMLQNK